MKNTWNFNIFPDWLSTHKDKDFPFEIEPLLKFMSPVIRSPYFHSVMLQDDNYTYFIGRNATDERNRFSLMKYFVKRLPRDKRIS